MLSKRVLSALAAAAVLSASTAALAGEDDIKYRKAVMKAVGGHMTSISTILKTDAGDMMDIVQHANAMAALARISEKAFPEGSGPMDGDTEATMAVWEKPDAFKKVAAAFVTHADKLAEVAPSGDKGEIGAALGALGKNACKACHDDFRQKK